MSQPKTTRTTTPKPPKTPKPPRTTDLVRVRVDALVRFQGPLTTVPGGGAALAARLTAAIERELLLVPEALEMADDSKASFRLDFRRDLRPREPAPGRR